MPTLKESTRIEAPQGPKLTSDVHLGGEGGGGRGVCAAVACSKRSDSGEQCEVKKAMEPASAAGLWEPLDPILVTFERICNFRDPNYLPYIEWRTLYFSQYRHSGTFANRKYEELSYPKNQKMCDLILVTLLKTSTPS